MSYRGEQTTASIVFEAIGAITAALLTGLDDLERLQPFGVCVRPGDVADLVHRVALEVRGG